MKITRSLTLTCAAALMVGACSGAETDPVTTSPAATTATTSVGTVSPSPSGSLTTSSPESSVTTTQTVAPTTASPTSPATPATVAGLEPEVALKQVRLTLGRSRTADRASGSAAARYRKLAYAGPAAQAAVAREKLRELLPKQTTQSVARDVVAPNLLAVSRAPKRPVVTLLQTVPVTGALPELYLLKTHGTGETSLIHWRAIMRPGATLGTFDARAEGSALLPSTTTQLLGAPSQLLRQYAAALGGKPVPAKSRLYRDDAYLSSIRTAAEREWNQVHEQAVFSQKYTVQPDSIVTIAKPDGSALVFAVIKRVDVYTVKSGGGYLTGSKAWLALQPRETQIREQATMTSLHFVAFDVPPAGATTKARLVAASDQLISASGE